MADMYNIPIGGEKIPVPAWATAEVQSRILRSVDRGNLLNAQGLNVLKSLVKATGASQLELNKLDRSLDNLADEFEKGLKENANATKTSGDGTTSAIKEGTKETSRAFNAFANKVKSVTKADVSSLSAAMDEVSNVLSDIPKIGGYLAAFATGIGVVIGVIEGFAKTTAELNNVGIGLHGSLVDLRTAAGLAGLDFENFGKVITNNQRAIRSLGDNISSGAAEFGDLSHVLRMNISEFGQFGLTNSALNDALADEIELVRLRGQLDKNNLDEQSESLTTLLREQTALAELTGTDRRERLRARQEALSNARNALFLSTQTGNAADNLGNFAAALDGTGNLGKRIEDSFTAAIRNNTDFGTFDNELAAMSASIPGIRELFDFYRSSYASMDPTEFQTQVNERVAGMLDEMRIDPQALTRLADLNTPLQGIAGDVIEAIAAMRGFTDITSEDAQASIDNFATAAEEGRLKILALPGAMETVVNSIKTKGVQMADTLLQQLTGAESGIEAGGAALVTALNSLSTRILNVDEIEDIEIANAEIRANRVSVLSGGTADVNLTESEQAALNSQLANEDITSAGDALLNADAIRTMFNNISMDKIASSPSFMRENQEYVDAFAAGDDGLAARIVSDERERRIRDLQSSIGLDDTTLLRVLNNGQTGEDARFQNINEYISGGILDKLDDFQYSIQNLQSNIDTERQRIARSEAGENEYWDFESSGRNRSASRIEDYQRDLVELYRNVASLTEGTGFVLDEAAVSGAFLQGNTVLSGMDSTAPISIVDADGNQMSDTLQSDISRVGGITEEQAANIIRLLSDSLTEQRRIRQNAEE